MNENFKDKVKKSRKSLYKISQETGLPYTTLNELMNEKKNINNTASETVYKLSLYFKCAANDILNRYALLENSKGTYLGVHYQWLDTDNGIELHVNDNGKDIVLTTLKAMYPDLYDCYLHQVPEMLIEDYIQEKREWAALL